MVMCTLHTSYIHSSSFFTIIVAGRSTMRCFLLHITYYVLLVAIAGTGVQVIPLPSTYVDLYDVRILTYDTVVLPTLKYVTK